MGKGGGIRTFGIRHDRLPYPRIKNKSDSNLQNYHTMNSHFAILLVASLTLNVADCFSTINTSLTKSSQSSKRRSLPSSAFIFPACIPPCFSDIKSARFQSPDIEDEGELLEIKKKILSLSLEQDDEKRRSTISSIINEKISQEDSQFLQIWDKTLIQVGSELQDEARRLAMIESESDEEGNKENTVSDGTTTDVGEQETANKSKEELQLWATIDMMIQSKTLIKKASLS